MLKGIDSDFRQKYVMNKIKAMQIQAEFPFLQEIINASYGNILLNGLDIRDEREGFICPWSLLKMRIKENL